MKWIDFFGITIADQTISTEPHLLTARVYCLIFKACDVMSLQHADAASWALIALNRQKLSGEGNQFALSKLGFNSHLFCGNEK